MRDALRLDDPRRGNGAVLVELGDQSARRRLPVTDTLPKEFQNTSKPSDRNQLAKVKLPAGSRFPLDQTVTVSQSFLRPLDRLLPFIQSARQP